MSDPLRVFVDLGWQPKGLYVFQNLVLQHGHVRGIRVVMLRISLSLKYVWVSSDSSCVCLTGGVQVAVRCFGLTGVQAMLWPEVGKAEPKCDPAEHTAFNTGATVVNLESAELEFKVLALNPNSAERCVGQCCAPLWLQPSDLGRSTLALARGRIIVPELNICGFQRLHIHCGCDAHLVERHS